MSTLVTTTAQIGTIKDAGGNANAMTINNAGNVTIPNPLTASSGVVHGGYELIQS